MEVPKWRWQMPASSYSVVSVARQMRLLKHSWLAIWHITRMFSVTTMITIMAKAIPAVTMDAVITAVVIIK